jgi:hypothetical protein
VNRAIIIEWTDHVAKAVAAHLIVLGLEVGAPAVLENGTEVLIIPASGILMALQLRRWLAGLVPGVVRLTAVVFAAGFVDDARPVTNDLLSRQTAAAPSCNSHVPRHSIDEPAER